MQKDNGGSNTYYTKKNINNIFLAILLIKLCPSMINLANQQFFTEERMWIEYCRLVTRRDFNKNLVMTVKDRL